MEVPAGGVEAPLGDRLRALIVTGHHHPAHDWRATTAALLHGLEQDPRVLVDVTETPDDLALPRLNDYQLVVLNYCNWEKPGLSEAAKTHFTRWLGNGGGVAVVHFANGAFHASLPGVAADSDWPEYRRIARRAWDHRGPSGHDAYGPFRVEMTGVDHPITRGLGAFDTVDELYFRQAGEEPITPLATARSKVTGRDEPMAWAHDYGKGRVFQTVLGHSAESVRKAAPLLRRGAVWAAGREPLGFDPPAQLLERAAFRGGSPWTPNAPAKRP
jgi:type 1 glutamine amidotransferase